VIESDDTAKKSAYVFIVLGLFEFISGILSGYISDRVNRFLVATSSTIIVELALIVSIICYYTENYTLCFIAGALWGTSDCLVSNMTMVITTTLFPD
jgi:MFS family permease